MEREICVMKFIFLLFLVDHFQIAYASPISGHDCESCPPGYGLTCLNQKRSCNPCKSNTYSYGHDGCEVCPQCGENERILISCKADRKTECECKKNHILDVSGSCIHCCHLFCKDRISTDQRRRACGNLTVLCAKRCNKRLPNGQNEKETGLSDLIIWIIVAAGILTIVIVIVIVLYIYYKDKMKKFLHCLYFESNGITSEKSGEINSHSVPIVFYNNGKTSENSENRTEKSDVTTSSSSTIDEQSTLLSDQSIGVEEADVDKQLCAIDGGNTQEVYTQRNNVKSIHFHYHANNDGEKKKKKTIQETGIGNADIEYADVRKEIDEANPISSQGKQLKGENFNISKPDFKVLNMISSDEEYPVVIDAFSYIYLGERNPCNKENLSEWFNFLSTRKPNFTVKQFARWWQIEKREDIVEYLFDKYGE